MPDTDDTIPNVYSDPLAHWFVTEAYQIIDTAAFITASAEQIVAAGIPLYRMAYFQNTLHPEISGKSYIWRRGSAAVMGSAPHGPDTEAEYRDSPMPPVVEQRKTIRFRLEDIALEDLKAPVLRNLKIEGCTDYVAQPLVFSTGQVDALSLVSDRPGGFATGDLRA